MRVITASASPVGHEVLTVSGTPVKLTPSAYAGPTLTATISVETASIRFWVDGGIPTITEGILLVAGDVLELDSIAEISKFTALAIAADATLNVAYSA